MNGIGNEIVVVDLRAGAPAIAAEEARAAAAPQGAPFDQLMALYPPRTPGTDAFMRIYNNDGSEAGACGNGTRCVAWIVADAERQGRARPSRPRPGCSTAGRATTACSPSTWARRASPGTRFRWPRNSATRAPSNCRSGRSTRRCCIRRRSSTWAIRTRSSGSTTSTPTISPASGRCSENHPIFPERANISLAHIVDREHIVDAHLGARRRPDAGLRLGRLRDGGRRGAPQAHGAQGDGDAARRRADRSSGARATTTC